MADQPTTTQPTTTTPGAPTGGLSGLVTSVLGGLSGVIGPKTSGNAPPQPNKYIGVSSPQWDQDANGNWFLTSGYTSSYGRPDEPGAYGTLKPKYYEGDEYALISGAGMSPETVAAIQAGMAAAKLMPTNYRIGAWDNDSVAAFKQVLTYANQNFLDWQTALGDLMTTGASIPGPKGPTFTAHLTNPDDIKSVFHQAAYNLLGGQFVDPAQADAFVNTFQTQELNAQRAAFNAQTGGGGIITDAPTAPNEAETQIKATDQAGVAAKRYNDLADVLGSILTQKAPTTPNMSPGV